MTLTVATLRDFVGLSTLTVAIVLSMGFVSPLLHAQALPTRESLAKGVRTSLEWYLFWRNGLVAYRQGQAVDVLAVRGDGGIFVFVDAIQFSVALTDPELRPFAFPGWLAGENNATAASRLLHPAAVSLEKVERFRKPSGSETKRAPPPMADRLSFRWTLPRLRPPPLIAADSQTPALVSRIVREEFALLPIAGCPTPTRAVIPFFSSRDCGVLVLYEAGGCADSVLEIIHNEKGEWVKGQSFPVRNGPNDWSRVIRRIKARAMRTVSVPAAP
jgi:hypothetical protein